MRDLGQEAKSSGTTCSGVLRKGLLLSFGDPVRRTSSATSSSGNRPATVPATTTISIPRSLRGPSSLRHRRAVFTCVASVVVVPTHHSASSMECPVCLMLPEGEVHQCNEVWPLPQEPCSPQPSNPNP